MKVILFGSTGMIGQGVLIECLNDSRVESVLVINRNSCRVVHPKLKEILHSDFYDLASVAANFTGYDVCLYCLGVTSVGLSEAEYHKNTFELTTKIAKIVLAQNKNLTFCYISGANTDSSETGKTMWARVKGKTENTLLKMPFESAYMFRPGFIQPMKGIKSRTKLYSVMYTIFKPLFLIIKHFENIATNTEILGKAMINVALKGYEKHILESKDINKMGKQ